jgi:hypothetical protein
MEVGGAKLAAREIKRRAAGGKSAVESPARLRNKREGEAPAEPNTWKSECSAAARQEPRPSWQNDKIARARGIAFQTALRAPLLRPQPRLFSIWRPVETGRRKKPRAVLGAASALGSYRTKPQGRGKPNDDFLIPSSPGRRLRKMSIRPDFPSKTRNPRAGRFHYGVPGFPIGLRLASSDKPAQDLPLKPREDRVGTSPVRNQASWRGERREAKNYRAALSLTSPPTIQATNQLRGIMAFCG